MTSESTGMPVSGSRQRLPSPIPKKACRQTAMAVRTAAIALR